MTTPIPVEQMRDRLMTLDVVRSRFDPTEGLAEYEFDTDGSTNKVHFELPESWNAGLKDRDDLEVTPAVIDIDGTEFALTKAAALEAATNVGIQKGTMMNTPGPILAPVLNWYYANGANGHRSLKLLAGQGGGVGFTKRGTITPFSNVALLDAAVDGVREFYGTDEVLADYKFRHDLDKTNLRLIVPSHTRPIASARAGEANGDPWSVGLELVNSVTGAHPLELSGYLFAWWCTNGCTMTHASSGKYRRKPSETPQNAYDWARNVVDDVLGDLEHEFDKVEHLTQIRLEGELTDTVNNLFERFSVPERLRDSVMNNLVETDDLSAYGLLAALTQVANDTDISDASVEALLRAGGNFVDAISDERCEVCHKF